VCLLVDQRSAVFLTVGSPTLAAYSLGLTVINSRWVYRKFDRIDHQNSRTAALILDRLQQVPLQVNSNHGLLSSLVALPENHAWWSTLLERLDHNHSWSIATAFGIAWIAIAYAFTLVDSFLSIGQIQGGSGQAVGSLWLWLLPVVIGWLLVPVSGRHKLAKAVNRTNEIAYIARSQLSPIDSKEPILVSLVSDERAIALSEKRGEVFSHEWKSDPIFNYSRVWGWVAAVEEVAEAFEIASKNVRRRRTAEWPDGGKFTRMDDELRSANEATWHHSSTLLQPRSRGWGEGAFSRAFVASLFALGLQWATTLSAVLTVYFTPTVGLGCLSVAYISYGILSTLSWAMLAVSSILSHHHSTHAHPFSRPRPQPSNRVSIAAWLSVFLRRISIIVAMANSVLVVAICTFHISGLFSSCYCGSGVLGRGSKRAFFTIIRHPGPVLDTMRGAWSGNIVLSGSFVVLFIGFVYLMTDNPYHYYSRSDLSSNYILRSH